MAEVTVHIPDDQLAQLQTFLEKQGAELDAFVSTALADRLAYENDDELQAEIAAKIDRGRADIEAGRFTDAKDAMRRIADKHGLKRPG